MSIINFLITDRTQSDVERLKSLAEIGWDNMTADEKLWWLCGIQIPLIATDGVLSASDGPLTAATGETRGAYNAATLNRVGQACAYIHGLMSALGYDVSGYTALKTDWDVDDVPTVAQMQTYLSTLAALKAEWGAIQAIPSTMNSLGYEGANNIEKLLVELDDMATRIGAVFIRSGDWNAYSGTGFYIKN